MLIQNQIRVPIDINPLLDITADYLRFITEFFEVINQSGPHIYHSALRLSPQSSVVWKLHNQQIHSPVERVLPGIPASWDSCTASIRSVYGDGYLHECRMKVACATWSPCGQSIAFSSAWEVEVRDSRTLEKTSTFQFQKFIESPSSLAFSPNGHLLVCSSHK